MTWTAKPARPLSARPRPLFGRVVRLLVLVVLVAALVPLLLIMAYRVVNPPMSALMAAQRLSGVAIDQRWVALEQMSPHLIAAVVTSEDARFCDHRGVDWGAIEEAIEEADDNGPRGASTIPMQTVKNLFLWPGRSYVRKAIELPLAYTADLAWPKRRTLEIYLNIAEWGPGIFGAEAAARRHFNRSAAELTPRQAALLAAALPNPHVRNAGRPGPLTRRLAARIEQRMRAAGDRLGCIAAPGDAAGHGASGPLASGR